MADSDEEVSVSQNSFISAEIAESDVVSDEDADIEERFDRLLDNAEIQERVRQSVLSTTRYKGLIGGDSVRSVAFKQRKNGAT